MKSISTKIILPVFLWLLSSNLLHSQELVLNLSSGQTEQYPVNEIQSIKFVSNSMIIHQVNGPDILFEISEILNYQFDLTGLSSLTKEIVEKPNLRIYPNPSSQQVNIEYVTRLNGDIIIEVLDNNGKVISEIYRGTHLDETKVKWNPGYESIDSGTYLCRVISGDTVVIEKIIIQ